MAVELDKEQVISLYETGMTKKEVAKILGTTPPTLSKFMKENDIQTRNDRKSRKTGCNYLAAYKNVSEEKVIISNSVNSGYTPKKIEKTSTQKNDNALNLYLPEKWNWRD